MPLGFQILKEEWQRKEVSLTHLKVFGCGSYVKVKDVARDKLDVKYVKCTFIGYGSDEMGYRFWDSKGHKVVRSKDVTFNEDSLYEAKDATDSKHELSSEITQSPGGSSDTSEGSENSGIYEDRGRSDKEGSEDGASSEEEGSETPHVRRSNRESRDPGVDYNEILSPFVKMTTIRLVLSIVASEDLHLEQLDVKIVFLHGDLDEDIYMAQPEGFQSAGKEENLVCKLKKSLYGSKQVPRQWYLKFDSSDMTEIKKLKRKLSQELEMKDLGFAKKILGKSIIRDKTKEARCQPLGDQFKLSKKQAPKMKASRLRIAKVPYALAVGSLLYAMVCTRPDIAHVVGVVSRFMSNPGREHWKAVKWLLRYLKGTSKATLCFSRKEVVLEGFSDSDYRGCIDSGKSTIGYVFTVKVRAVSLLKGRRFELRAEGSRIRAEGYDSDLMKHCGVVHDSTRMFLSKCKYATQIFERAHIVNCNLSRTPMDIESKLELIVIRYLIRVYIVVLQLYSSSTTSLFAYSDRDWAGYPTTRRLTLGYCMFLGNNLLSWSFKRLTLSRSSVKAEYRGVANDGFDLIMVYLFAPSVRNHIFYTLNVVPCSKVLGERCSILLSRAKVDQVVEIIGVEAAVGFCTFRHMPFKRSRL
ncbi:retrovirus-related pol polyprotein from transposon TNT 1-94 [Tanacetum coccineum]